MALSECDADVTGETQLLTNYSVIWMHHSCFSHHWTDIITSEMHGHCGGESERGLCMSMA